MCVRMSCDFTFTCPETGLMVNGRYNDETGRMELRPEHDGSQALKTYDCTMWCIRSESSSHLSWDDARARLISRGVKPEELQKGSESCHAEDANHA